MAYCHVYPFISFVNEVIEANDANIYLSYCKINKVVTATDIEVYKYKSASCTRAVVACSYLDSALSLNVQRSEQQSL